MTYPPAYMGSGDPARRRTDYYPEWLDDLADDVTCEAAAMEGAAQGAEAVREIVVTAKTLYEYQEFNFAGPYGDNGFLEDYTTQVHGQPTGVVVTVTRNAARQTQHIVVNHRPRSSSRPETSRRPGWPAAPPTWWHTSRTPRRTVAEPAPAPGPRPSGPTGTLSPPNCAPVKASARRPPSPPRQPSAF
jgi:hypothetical protein